MAYVRPVNKTTWYLGNRDYTIHMINEFVSVFVGLLALILLWMVGAVASGPEAYQSFLDSISSPGMVILLWIITIVMFYHAYAWFSVTPKAMPVQKGTDFLPGSIIAGAHYAVWAILTLIVLALAGVF